MEKRRIPSFAEFASVKPAKSKEIQEVTEIQESLNDDNLNEGFLDAILRFFKGIFDLFNDKTVKKEVEDSSEYFNGIVNDENISDDELIEEIDVKRVRKTSKRIVIAIKKRIDIDEEEKVELTSKIAMKKISGWFAMIIAYKTALKAPFMKKMLNNPDLAKKFTWVPRKFTVSDSSVKLWYKDKDCIFDDSVIKPELVKLLDTPSDQMEKAIQTFTSKYFMFIVKKQENGEKLLRDNDHDFLEIIIHGFAAMCDSVTKTMESIIENSTDDKLAEVIAEEIITERKRKGSKGKKKIEQTDDSPDQAKRVKKTGKPSKSTETQV